MTSAVETGSMPKESKFTKEFFWKKTKSVLGYTAVIGTVGLWAWLSAESQQTALDNLRANGEHEKSVAIGLARAGFTNIVAIEANDGIAVATLSADPTDKSACSISFVASTGENGQIQLSLEQKDAAGRSFSTATLTDGAKAPQLVEDLCN